MLKGVCRDPRVGVSDIEEVSGGRNVEQGIEYCGDGAEVWIGVLEWVVRRQGWGTYIVLVIWARIAQLEAIV